MTWAFRGKIFDRKQTQEEMQMDPNFAMVVFGIVVVALVAMGRHIKARLDDAGVAITTKESTGKSDPRQVEDEKRPEKNFLDLSRSRK